MIQFMINFVLILSVFFGVVQDAIAEKEGDYDALPPFTTSKVKPNVLIMLDNSGSMKSPMYTGDYKDYLSFHGIFQSDKNYQYDATIAVDTAPYAGVPYSIPAADIDTDQKGAFKIAATSCDFSSATNDCWSGNFLNWLTTRRIDSARMVLVGGKVENRTPTGPWKIVGNNEPSDRDYTKLEDKLNGVALQDVSPFTEGDFSVTSPAIKGNAISTGEKYDLYAKLNFSLGNLDDPYLIINVAGDVIGEIGTIKDVDEEWKTVTLRRTYIDPVVVAGPLTFKGGDPSTIRIDTVTSTSFEIHVDEYKYQNLTLNGGSHTNETIYYVVLEEGTHALPGVDGSDVEVEAIISTSTHSLTTIPLSGTFSDIPVFLGAAVTTNGSDPVIARFKDLSITEGKIWLEEEERDGTHASETVHAIVFEQKEFFLKDPAKKIVVGIAEVNEEMTNVYSGDLFVANLQTEKSSDPCSLRIDDTGSVMAEEDTSDDREQIITKNTTGGVPETETIGFIYRTSSATNSFNIAVMSDEEPVGILHDIQDTVRLGLSFYNYQKDSEIYDGETTDGGTLRLFLPLNPFVEDAANTSFREIVTPVTSTIDTVVDAVEHYPLVWGTTPLAENLVEVINYFMQPASNPYEYDDQIPYYPFDVDAAWDPYYYSEYSSHASCAQSSVLIFTDGYPYKDGCIPATMADASGTEYALVDSDGDSAGEDARLCDQDGDNEKDADDNLDDVAYWGHHHDLRDLEDDQNLTIYTIGFAGGTIRPILSATATNGGGKAYAAEDGETLRNAFTDIFKTIQNNASSGTAAGVVSQSRTGVGGVYQAVFYQERKSDYYDIDEKRATWAGNIHSFFIDEYGFMREDSDGDHTLNFGVDANGDGVFDVVDDSYGDYIVVPDPDASDDQLWNKWYDWDNDNIIDDCLDVDVDGDCDTFALEELNFVWSAAEWLNDAALDAQTQRVYTDTTKERYIFTFLDQDGDMIADSGEQVDFTRNPDSLFDPKPSIDWCSDFNQAKIANFDSMFSKLNDKSTLYPYMTLFPSFGDTSGDVKIMQGNYYEIANDGELSSGPIPTSNQGPYQCFLIQQTARLIDYIRGEDITSELNIQDSIETSTEYTFPVFRNRQGDFDNDSSTVETWRLGDIIHSTPTMVAKPAEGYHLLYRDTSYGTYLAQYANRRAVVYTGANDGMLHAFNGGFFDSDNYEFKTTWQNSETEFELGAELWAYVPFNLLPHLFWLTESDYGKSHAYYVDLKPRVFDAKIFPDDAVHPGGWGTLLVGGMRFGGGQIRADMDKTDPASWDAATESFSNYVDGTDQTMTSAFFILDITNPEAPPTVLAELSFDGLGYTTCYPTVVPFGGDELLPINKWYLVFGNGPASSAGIADTISLETGASTEKGRVHVVDLGLLVGYGQLGNSSPPPADFYTPYQELDSDSFISDPIAVDYDLDYNTDAVYFGTVSGDESSGWGGKLRRLVAEDNSDPATWTKDSVFFNPGKPIVAAPSVGLDNNGERWIYVGTGRYFVDGDEQNTDLQQYYGLKEPMNTALNPAVPTWSDITGATEPSENLIDVTNTKVYQDQSVAGTKMYSSGWVDLKDGNGDVVDTFTGLVAEIDDNYKGWKIDLVGDTDNDGSSNQDGERNLGQAALLGDVLSFSTYLPPAGDPCLTQGQSMLYALFYKTGTAYYKPIIGWYANNNDDVTDSNEYMLKSLSIGKGLSITPNIHVGRQDGSKVVIQTSTGLIETFEESNPGVTKSGKTAWKERR